MDKPNQTTVFSLDDLKHPDVAKRIQDKIAMAIVGVVPDEFWQPMVTDAINELFPFTIELSPRDKTVSDVSVSSYRTDDLYFVTTDAGCANGIGKEIVTTFDYEEFKRCEKLRSNYYKEAYKTVPVYMWYKKRDAKGSYIYKGDTTDYDLDLKIDRLEWYVSSVTESKFVNIVKNEASKQGEQMLRYIVGQYFTTPFDPQNRPAIDGGFGAMVHPSEMLKEQLQKAMPDLITSIFSSMLANQMSNFLMYLQNQRNGYR